MFNTYRNARLQRKPAAQSENYEPENGESGLVRLNACGLPREHIHILHARDHLNLWKRKGGLRSASHQSIEYVDKMASATNGL